MGQLQNKTVLPRISQVIKIKINSVSTTNVNYTLLQFNELSGFILLVSDT